MKAATLNHSMVHSIVVGETTYTVGEPYPDRDDLIEAIIQVGNRYEIGLPNYGRVVFDSRNVHDVVRHRKDEAKKVSR